MFKIFLNTHGYHVSININKIIKIITTTIKYGNNNIVTLYTEKGPEPVKGDLDSITEFINSDHISYDEFIAEQSKE
ncbi:MAG: hypothetical protein ACRCX2_07725 [Paraclostridium sp.]